MRQLKTIAHPGFLLEMLAAHLANPAWPWDSQPRVVGTLRMEKSKRIEFSHGKWVTRGTKTAKSVQPYVQVSLSTCQKKFRSLLWLWEALFWAWEKSRRLTHGEYASALHAFFAYFPRIFRAFSAHLKIKKRTHFLIFPNFLKFQKFQFFFKKIQNSNFKTLKL